MNEKSKVIALIAGRLYARFAEYDSDMSPEAEAKLVEWALTRAETLVAGAIAGEPETEKD